MRRPKSLAIVPISWGCLQIQCFIMICMCVYIYIYTHTVYHIVYRGVHIITYSRFFPRHELGFTSTIALKADLSMRGKVPSSPHPVTEMTLDVPLTGRFLKIEILQNYGAQGGRWEDFWDSANFMPHSQGAFEVGIFVGFPCRNGRLIIGFYHVLPQKTP